MIGFAIMVADIVSNLSVRVLQHFLTTKQAFVCAFLFGFCVTIGYQYVRLSPVLVPVFVLLMRASVATGFSLSYYANYEYFPTELKSTVYAVTNVFARSAIIVVAMVVEKMDRPIFLLTGIMLFASISSMFLKKIKDTSVVEH